MAEILRFPQRAAQSPAGTSPRLAVGSRGRAQRLTTLAHGLDTSLVHTLVELAELAWTGDDADRAIDDLRVCAFRMRVASAGIKNSDSVIDAPESA